MSNWSHNVVSNSEDHREFAHALGYAVLNFADIELFSFSYAAALGETHIFDTGLAKKSFAQRVKIVRQQLDGENLSESLTSKINSLWDEALDIMKWRNIIAHNPISIISFQQDGGAKHRHTAIIDMQKTTSTKTQQIALADLAKIVNQAEKVAKELSVGLDELRIELGTV